MGIFIKVIGVIIFLMETVSKLMRMEILFREDIGMVENKDQIVCTYGKILINMNGIKEDLNMIIFMEWVK